MINYLINAAIIADSIIIMVLFKSGGVYEVYKS